MFISIPFGFLRTYGPKVWRDIDRYEAIMVEAEASGRKLSPKDEVLLLEFLKVRCRPPNGDCVASISRGPSFT